MSDDPQTSQSNDNGASRVVLLVLSLTIVLMSVSLFNRLDQPNDSPDTANSNIGPMIVRSPTSVVATVALPSANIRSDTSVGIVSGHRGYDPGAVCDDGLTEATLNYNIAVEVVELLERRGLQVDLLDEFDARLTGYQASALVSIHADSCTVPGATGFKVARVTDSAIPEAEDALVDCLNQTYGRYTGLNQHPSSITDDMTNYHAFREIDPLTPGAIIETGFMLDDRFLLENRPKIVARGIAAGILCFLDD